MRPGQREPVGSRRSGLLPPHPGARYGQGSPAPGSRSPLPPTGRFAAALAPADRVSAPRPGAGWQGDGALSPRSSPPPLPAHPRPLPGAGRLQAPASQRHRRGGGGGFPQLRSVRQEPGPVPKPSPPCGSRERGRERSRVSRACPPRFAAEGPGSAGLSGPSRGAGDQPRGRGPPGPAEPRRGDAQAAGEGRKHRLCFLKRCRRRKASRSGGELGAIFFFFFPLFIIALGWSGMGGTRRARPGLGARREPERRIPAHRRRSAHRRPGARRDQPGLWRTPKVWGASAGLRQAGRCRALPGSRGGSAAPFRALPGDAQRPPAPPPRKPEKLRGRSVEQGRGRPAEQSRGRPAFAPAPSPALGQGGGNRSRIPGSAVSSLPPSLFAAPGVARPEPGPCSFAMSGAWHGTARLGSGIAAHPAAAERLAAGSRTAPPPTEPPFPTVVIGACRRQPGCRSPSPPRPPRAPRRGSGQRSGAGPGVSPGVSPGPRCSPRTNPAAAVPAGVRPGSGLSRARPRPYQGRPDGPGAGSGTGVGPQPRGRGLASPGPGDRRPGETGLTILLQPPRRGQNGGGEKTAQINGNGAEIKRGNAAGKHGLRGHGPAGSQPSPGRGPAPGEGVGAKHRPAPGKLLQVGFCTRWGFYNFFFF